MILTTQFRTLLAAGAFAAASTGSVCADFIDTGWSHVSNWDNLLAGYFSGVASTGVWSSGIAPTSGWNAVAKAAGTADNASYIAADKPVELIKTSGGHYAASMGLYAFMGAEYSTFNFNVGVDVSNWESVIFQERKGPNPDYTVAAPTLVIGTERYSAMTTDVLFLDSVFVDAIGSEATIKEVAYQWDLRGLDLSNGFTIEYEVAIHESLQNFQIAGTETFGSVVVPEPSTYAMILGGITLCGVCYKRRKAGRSATR